MDTKNKNPLFSGLMNVALPGSSQLYVNKDWISFLGSFLVGIVAYFAVLWLGNLIQDSRMFTLPNGSCTGPLLLIVIAALFWSGQKTAKDRNNESKSSVFYNSKRAMSHESDEKQYAHIQSLRDDGLISEEEFDEKNAKVKAKHSK
jgi:hypothetical protein